MPELTMLTSLFFGFLLGVKHALDADHVVAVTTIVSRSRSILRAVVAGLSWGIGHTVALFAAGFVVLVFRLTIPDKLSLSMEFAVGIILVLLGVPLVKQLVKMRSHVHLHKHEDKNHMHGHTHGDTQEHDHQYIRRPLLVGMAHGLAGSGALTILVLGSMSSVTQGLIFLLLFGVGSILSMLLVSGLIGFSFRLTAGRSTRLSMWVQGAAGLISVALGLFVMWKTVFVGGLFFSAA